MQRVSVVIPVYNVAKYLHRCVDSVLNQTYKDIEVILVDDGSSDECPVICDEYARRDSRVTALHKKNGGQSSARNYGLSIPLTGDYITFLDSDDWIENDTIEYCLNLINRYDADMAEYCCEDTRLFIEHAKQPKEKIDIIEGKAILEDFLRREAYSVCMSLFRKDLLLDLRFREGKINEDVDFKYKVLQRCKKIVLSNQKKYFYFQAGNSTSMGGLLTKDFDLYDAAEEIYHLTKCDESEKVRLWGEAKKKKTAFSLLCKIAYYGVADKSLIKKEVIKTLLKQHRENVWTLVITPMPISRKVLAILFAINYHLTELVVRLLKRFLVY